MKNENTHSNTTFDNSSTHYDIIFDPDINTPQSILRIDYHYPNDHLFHINL